MSNDTKLEKINFSGGSNYDLLKDAVDSGIIDLSDVKHKLEMVKRKEILEKHPYAVYQGSDGAWYTCFPNEGGGRTKKRRVSKEVLENLIIEYWKDKDENPTIEEVFNKWIDRKLKLNKIQKSTYDRYKRVYNRHYSEFGKRHIKGLEPEEIGNFLEEQISECELTAKAFSLLKGITNGFLIYARKEKLIKFSVTDMIKELDISDREFKKIIKEDYEEVFSDEEWDVIIPYLTENLDIWNMGILLMFITGIRIGELVTLKHCDFDKDCRTLSIRRTETTYKDENNKAVYEVKDFPKTKAGVRSIAIPEDYAWLIKKIKLLNPFEEYIFVRNGKRMTTNSFRRRLDKVEDSLGIYHKSPHKIRKTYGSILLDNNVDNRFVIDQMGHSAVAVTENFYHRNRRTTDQKIKTISAISEFKAV